VAKTKPVTMDDIGGKVKEPTAQDLANIKKNVASTQASQAAANVRTAARAPKPAPPKPVSQSDRIKESVKLRRQLVNEFDKPSKKGGY